MDESRFPDTARLRVKLHPGECFRADVREQYVAGIENPAERIKTGWLAQIQADEFLVAIEVKKLPRQLTGTGWTAERAQEIALRRLDLDDFRAEVGEPQRRRRSDDDGREIKNADTC
jgi:hypothetical protein